MTDIGTDLIYEGMFSTGQSVLSADSVHKVDPSIMPTKSNDDIASRAFVHRHVY
jgi:hypothetical protein